MSKKNMMTDKEIVKLAKSFRDKSTSDINEIIVQLNDVLEQQQQNNIRLIYEQLEIDIHNIGFENVQEFISAAESLGLLNLHEIQKKVPIRYRNPENLNETWTGRGKKPRWLVAKLEIGYNIEDFEV